MTADASSFPNLQRNLNAFTRVIKFAACEWILIFLLFVDAALSYTLTSFARYCELEIPCILCSRLDHVFGNAKEGFYRTLFCRNHRSEISFLSSCDIHDKLVDSRGMCDDCLSSHVVEGRESNSDMQSLFSQSHGVTRLCLCCNKPRIPKPSSNRLLPTKSDSTVLTKLNIPLHHCLSHVHDLKMTSDKFQDEHDKECAADANESRDVRCLVPESENVVCEHKEKKANKKDDFNELPELISLDDYSPSSSLMEVQRFSSSLLTDLISQVDTKHSVNVKDVPVESFSDKYVSDACVSTDKNDEILNMIIASTGARFETDPDVDDTPITKSTVADPSAPEFVTKYMLAYTNGANEDHKSSSSATKNENITNMISTEAGTGFETDFETDRFVDDTAIVDSTNEYPSVCDEDTSASEFVTNEDVKSLPKQNSSGEGVHLSLNNLSPELQDRAVELLRTESNSADIRNLKKLFFEATNESDDLKYFDESNLIEGENVLDKLKQQVENYRNYISALSKELDEERNASSIAANQAMAMITRLQEEKAALRMEALQYLRMMEEQAEYDGDALYKANELLTDKEKELQDLEDELEYYKLNFLDETLEETEHEHEHEHATRCSKHDSLAPTMFPGACVVDASPGVMTTWSEIEGEKSYISHCLQKLEKKLNKLAQYAPPHLSSSTSINKDEEISDEHEEYRENGLQALENEILDLNERMEALEGDCIFLQHALNSLKNGNEGLVLIQEILYLLREVKKIGLKTMNPSVL